MDITVKVIGGETQSLRVHCDATVNGLKELISPHFNVLPSQQKLSASNGQRINLDDGSRTLSSYGLHSGSTVVLLITNPVPMQVFVKNEGEPGTYTVDADETVDQLQQKVFNKERVPVDQQRLIFNGRQLEAGRKLKDYNIESRSTIHMTHRLRGG